MHLTVLAQETWVKEQKEIVSKNVADNFAEDFKF